jgi:uncharacterized membrane protein
MMMRSIGALISAWRRYRRSSRGAAAAEFAIMLPLLTIPVLNAIDLGVYAYDRMELNLAAQVAAQQAWVLCAVNGKVPATVTVNGKANCPGFGAAETLAAQSMTLGSSVTITSTVENYYCLNGSNQLVVVGPVTSPEPADCTSANPKSTDAPGDYVLVTASYSYSPLFAQVSVASKLTTPITQTAWMRLN